MELREKENNMPKTRESTSPKVKKPPAARKHPERDEIAMRAYQIYLERGGAPGDALDDWTRAEREVLAKNGKSHRKPKPKSKTT
jgi:hypothetical protein